MIYGYARVSSKDQNLDRQLVELRKFGVPDEHIYYDKQSGKDFDRVNYQKMKGLLKESDLLVIKSIDRLGRNYDMIIDEWTYITKTVNCDVVVLDMNLLDTRCDGHNLVGKFIADIVLQILSFVAENERENIRQRQAEGIQIAKEKGVKFGRPCVDLTPEILKIFEKFANHQLTISQALAKSNLKKSSFYKYYDQYCKKS